MSDPRAAAPARFSLADGATLSAPPWLRAVPDTGPVPAAFRRHGAPPPSPRPAAPPPAAEPPPPVLAVDPALEAQLEQTIEAFAAAAAGLAAARAQVLRAVEQDLVELALAIASALVERELAADPRLHLVLARAALATLGDPQGARLRASRPAYDAIVEVSGGATLSCDGVAVEVVADDALEGLGVVAEGDATRVDGRLQERLRAVLRALDDERVRSSNEEAG